VHYHVKNHPFYRCMHQYMTASEQICFGITGNVVDELVSGQVLRALEPAALELSLKARADLRRERERLDKHWKQKMQRARYDVELAERRYQAVDAANRLVAATLERQWEEAPGPTHHPFPRLLPSLRISSRKAVSQAAAFRLQAMLN